MPSLMTRLGIAMGSLTKSQAPSSDVASDTADTAWLDKLEDDTMCLWARKSKKELGVCVPMPMLPNKVEMFPSAYTLDVTDTSDVTFAVALNVSDPPMVTSEIVPMLSDILHALMLVTKESGAVILPAALTVKISLTLTARACAVRFDVTM